MIRVVCLLLLLAGAPLWARDEVPLRIGLTPVFLDHQTSFLEEWRTYLEGKLSRPVVFAQRSSYRGVVELMLQGELDFAWLCGYPYVRNRADMSLLVTPVYQGAPLYRSYLIVPASDTTTHNLADLRGRIFAYSDPDSNSGYLVTQHRLLESQPGTHGFFRRTFFTWSHRKVVEAVAANVADGGAVDGYVWDTLAQLHPELTARTRVVERSASFGFPPIVARQSVSTADMAAMREVLLAMSSDERGRALLARLNLDGFQVAEPELYQGIETMMAKVLGGRRAAQP